MNSHIETIDGVYTLTDKDVSLTLALRTDSIDSVVGTLAGTNGQRSHIAGRLQGGMVVGVCSDEEEGRYFEARQEGESLHFTLIEPDSSHMPDYATAREMIFTRQESVVPPGLLAEPCGDEIEEDSSDLMHHLSGTWVCLSGGKRTEAVFLPDGSYLYRQESSHLGPGAVHYGDPDALRNDYADDRGEWWVKGGREHGVIMLGSSRGGKGRVEYQVRRENGQPVWDRYWFNRELFVRR